MDRIAGYKRKRSYNYQSKKYQPYPKKPRYDTQTQSSENTVVIYKSSGEVKGVDTNLNAAIGAIVNTTNTNAGIAVLNLVQTGNGSWNRVGKKISLRSLKINGQFVLNGLAGDCAPDFARMAVVWDKQPSSATIPVFSDIFGRTAQDGTETTLVEDPPKYDNMGRFKVLLDKKFSLNPGYERAANGMTCQYTINEYLKLRGLETIFSGQSAPMTIADISTGALYLVIRQGDASANSIVSLSAGFMCRLRYTD